MPSRVSQVRFSRFQLLDDAQALLGVAEALRHKLRQRLLARVAEGRVADVVRQSGRLGEVLVQVQAAGDRAGDLGDLQRVREAGDEVIADGRDEHLRLVLEAPERLAVEDPVAVPLELGAHGRRRLPGSRGRGSRSFARRKATAIARALRGARARQIEVHLLRILTARRASAERMTLATDGGRYSTVTVFARFRGWSTSQPRRTAT